MNSMNKENKETGYALMKKEKETLKPIKGRKSMSSKDINENTTTPFNFSLPLSITNLNNLKHNDKEEEGITMLTSPQNINRFIQVYSCRSRAGNQMDGSRKTNQDSFLEQTKIFGLDEFSVFGVYDGHGIGLVNLI